MKRSWISAGVLLATLGGIGLTGFSSPAWAKSKEKSKTYSSSRSDRPAGWNRGRKSGWRGDSLPPGLAKKRNRNDDDRIERRRERREDRREDRRERRRERREDRYDDRYDDRAGRGTILTGEILGASGGFSRSITVGTGSGSVRLSVPRNVPVTRYGQPISLHEIREGERVQVRYRRASGNSLQVTRIDVV